MCTLTHTPGVTIDLLFKLIIFSEEIHKAIQSSYTSSSPTLRLDGLASDVREPFRTRVLPVNPPLSNSRMLPMLLYIDLVLFKLPHCILNLLWWYGWCCAHGWRGRLSPLLMVKEGRG